MVFFSVVDVIVHRLLAASLGIYRLPDVLQDKAQLTSVSDSKNHITYTFITCSLCNYHLHKVAEVHVIHLG